MFCGVSIRNTGLPSSPPGFSYGRRARFRSWRVCQALLSSPDPGSRAILGVSHVGQALCLASHVVDAEGLKPPVSAIDENVPFRSVRVGRFLLVPRRPLQGTSEADHRLSVPSFPALLVLPGSQERRKCSGGRVEDEWLVTRPHASLNLEQATGRRVDNDPPLVSTLDAAALSERNRDAGPGGLLGLREPAGFRDLAVFVQGRSSMGSSLVSFRPGWVLTCGNGLASGKLKPAFADGRKTATG